MTTRERITCMLGPSEPEIGCDECFDLLDVHVEAELRGEPGVPGMPPHLDGCPACAGEHEALLALADADET
jgi:hypothetical protein